MTEMSRQGKRGPGCVKHGPGCGKPCPGDKTLKLVLV